jgi:hypothetical protein
MEKVSVSIRDDRADVPKQHQEDGDTDNRGATPRRILDEYEWSSSL